MCEDHEYQQYASNGCPFALKKYNKIEKNTEQLPLRCFWPTL